ncbi:uncharacterized protein LOC125046802 [Penaeus chinensis]|uniref:uncharacterized protein LOC125046802 n=1 Tax=Penaeus chinensis TaxID=139456 RepID=UPI001FB78ED1|nr:uncharacterized protein LOC125046802 [Penaeus chinensis]
MAFRFSWFLCPLLALLFCHGAALSDDVRVLQQMEKEMKGDFPNGKQFAVLYLPGKKLNHRDCCEIQFNNTRRVDAHCNFSPVFNQTLEGHLETERHSEWQLINTALRPMLEKWKSPGAYPAKGYARKKRMYRTKKGNYEKRRGQMRSPNSRNTEKGNGAGETKGRERRRGKDGCPEALYLYSRLAPDYDCKRRHLGNTCTQAIVTTIPKILKDVGCEGTRIVVGFSKVRKQYKTEACEGYQCMKENNVTEYHLESNDPQKEYDCTGVKFLKPTYCTYIINSP